MTQDGRSLEPAGYGSGGYVQSLAAYGTPVRLPRSGGWLLAAGVGDSGDRDAFGPYPLFAVEHPEHLAHDLAALKDDLVSVYAVSDPLREEQLEHFAAAFDFVRPYKPHYIVDLETAFDRYLRRHHRRYARKALAQIDVVCVTDPAAYVAEWTSLYEELCVRHRITGLRRFSQSAFSAQLAVPGCRYFRALHGSAVVGGFICYLDRDRAYAHLISTTQQGQDLLAPYALYWTAIESFRGSARLLDLGGVPGGMDAAASGLSFFKSGWSTSIRRAMFCGRILNEAAYERLCAASPGGSGKHFPAYRSGILGAS